MKQELLEALTRLCVREVLSQMREEEDKKETPPEDTGDTKGAPAPPADDQGTADQPGVPSEKPDAEPEKKPDDDSSAPAGAAMKGVILVNPRDKSKLQQVPLKATGDDASLERNLHRLAATLAGSNAKVSLQAQRMARDAVRNPTSSVYLYLGKYDPSSDEIFLMADKSLQVAKDGSIPPAELTGTPVSSIAPSDFNPMTASPGEFGARMQQKGQTPVYGIDEQFRAVVKRMVHEILKNR